MLLLQLVDKVSLCRASRLKVSDKVLTLSSLLNSSEDHLCSLDVLLWVLEVFKKSLILPDNTRLLVGRGVRVTTCLSRLTSEESVKIRSLLVSTSLLYSVALRTLGLENLCSFLFVSSLLLS